MLANHPDQRFQIYITEGIWRFRVGYNHQSTCFSARGNMPSAEGHREKIRDYLGKECMEGRVLGPIGSYIFPCIQVSSFGVIPKELMGKFITELTIRRNNKRCGKGDSQPGPAHPTSKDRHQEHILNGISAPRRLMIARFIVGESYIHAQCNHSV